MTVRLPPMKIAQGEAFAYSRIIPGRNFTGYTGAVTFKSSPKANWRTATDWPFSEVQEPFLTATVAGDAAGVLTFNLTAAQTGTFPSLDRLGYFKQAVAEITMTNGADVQIYQATVSVSGRI